MNQLGQRFWNTSPGSFARAFRRRVRAWQARPMWHKVQTGPLAGAELFLPRADEGGLQEMVAGTFDHFLYDSLKQQRNLQEATCWDIGAHIGYHSLGFAALGANVLAFEPNLHNAKYLRMHLKKNSALGRRIRHIAAAVAEQDGEMTFVQSSDVSGSSSGSHLATALPPLEKATYSSFVKATVPTIRIDTLIEERGEKAPDVIKIDVEGAEAMVLRGGQHFLTRHKPIILMEVHHIRLMFEVQELLLRWGFKLQLLDQEHASSSRCFLMAH